MGTGDARLEARDKRTAARNKRAEAKRGRERRVEQYELQPLAWLALGALAQIMADAGGAVRIGYSRDRGALALGCYMGDDYATEYVRPADDLWSELQAIADAWTEGGAAALHEAYGGLADGVKRDLGAAAPK